eukprot:m.102032 g.102032  ORF g.102032 m.102032 type:complete len:215 (-) comp27375_c1_seq1:118-762(-)
MSLAFTMAMATSEQTDTQNIVEEPDITPQIPITPPTLEELVAEAASDYSQYVDLSGSSQLQYNITSLTQEVDTVLARMDEFHSLITQIQGDTESFIDTTVPLLSGTCAKLRDSFERISQLESFVAIVKKNVQQMDDEVTAMERSYTLHPLQNQLRSARNLLTDKFNLLMQSTAGKDSPAGTPPQAPPTLSPLPPKRTIPEVFHTSDFFPKPDAK